MAEKLVLSYAKGITHSPSDLLCGDGELEECINLEVKNEELIPMEMPVRLGFSLSENEKLILVHNTKTEEKHYVTENNGTIRIYSITGNSKNELFSLECGDVKSIQAIGNTIVAYTQDSLHYILYINSAYKYLGGEIPEIDLSFSLKGDFALSNVFELKTPDAEAFDEDFQRTVSEMILAEVNKFVENKSTNPGKFMFPFFVRYALRMFDGTYTHHSAPILMLPSTNIAPFVVSNAVMEGDNSLINKVLDAQIGSFIAQLEVSILNVEETLSEWKDVITAVDIFVSKPIYTYDQNGYKFYTGGNAIESEASQFVGKYKNDFISIWDGYTQMKNLTTVDSSESYLYRWHIPRRDIEDINGDIVNTSLFYKYASVLLESLTLNKPITLSGSLSIIEVSETMSDDYMTHDIFIPESSFVYNGRLNISNIKRKLFRGFPAHSMAQMVQSEPTDGFERELSFGHYEIYTFIKSPNGGNDMVVKSFESNEGAFYGAYFFYPDTDAYKMIIVDKVNNRYAQIGLTEHPLLNGSFAFIGFNGLTFATGTVEFEEENNFEMQLNKLYTSNVNNPFHFPLEGIYTVGSDRIIGMGAITRPISQGQFGEFPLIVFCSDGNYAMRVDEQGFYAAISPIQEDVVLGWDKVTAMENSLVIITKKGIMLTSGGEMKKIATQMDGGVWDISSLDNIETSVEQLSNVILKSKDNEGFLSYVYGARMAFDYASNRLLVYNPNKTYSFFYHFDNDTVSKMVINGGKRIISSVLDYPDTIIQDESGELYSLYTKEDVSVKDTRQYGVILTRPLKLGAALSMKSVKQIRHLSSNKGNGSFVKYILYGSNDNINYYRISSRFGKPYKYYRVAIYTNLCQVLC